MGGEARAGGASCHPLRRHLPSAAPVPISPARRAPSGSRAQQDPARSVASVLGQARTTAGKMDSPFGLHPRRSGGGEARHSRSPWPLLCLALGVCLSAGPGGRAWTPPILRRVPRTQADSPQEALHKYVRDG